MVYTQWSAEGQIQCMEGGGKQQMRPTAHMWICRTQNFIGMQTCNAICQLLCLSAAPRNAKCQRSHALCTQTLHSHSACMTQTLPQQPLCMQQTLNTNGLQNDTHT